MTQTLAITSKFQVLDGINLPRRLFQAKAVYFASPSKPTTEFLGWVADSFPHLQELYVPVDSPFRTEPLLNANMSFPNLIAVHSLDDFCLPFWEKLVACAPNLSLIRLSKSSPFRGEISRRFPHIVVGNYRPPHCISERDN